MYGDEDEDDWEDPYLNMTMEELKERLPAYMFKNAEEKKVYFNELNKSYYKEITQVPALQEDEDRPKAKLRFSKMVHVRSKKTLKITLIQLSKAF